MEGTSTAVTVSADLHRLRLCNQHVEGPPFERSADVVRWLGAVQAQDYAAARWALGLRMGGGVAAEVDRALAEASIMRTHVMRPTWHFVSPEDVRWMLTLTAPRILAGSARRYRELQLDDTLLRRTDELLARALERGTRLTRAELGRVLEEAGVETSTPQRLVYALMHAELAGVIVSGPRRGKEFTYALLDERVPPGRAMGREEAVAELVRRYFTSHGPATLRDFAWWSGLTTADARMGIEALHGQIVSERIDGKSYWMPQNSSGDPSEALPSVHLLPAFDEYTVAYAERDGLLLPEHSPKSNNVILGPVVVVDSHVAGTWRRTFRRGSVLVEVTPFTEFGEVVRRGVAAAAARYGEFHGMPTAMLQWGGSRTAPTRQGPPE